MDQGVILTLDVIKNTVDSWEEVKMSILIGVCRKLIPIFMDDFEWLKTLVEKVNADMVKTARKLELKMKYKE